MASNVSNALGTERQFSGQPQGIYEKRLLQSDGAASAAAATRNSGLQLAQALGVLGDQVALNLGQQEKDKEKIGIAKAEEIAAGQTEDSWRKLSAIDMISASGNVSTADNPYAVSMIEKMRGKYLASRARTAYDTDVIQQQGHAKTADEEVARYNKYMQDNFGKSQGVSSDLEAFQKGFWDNHAVDQLGVADAQVKWNSQQMDAIRQGETAASLRANADKWMVMPKEDLVQSWNTTMADNRLANASIPERIAQIRTATKDFVQQTGDYDKLKYVLDNVTIGVGKDGKEIKASSVISPEDYRQDATIRTRQIFGERMQKDLKSLSEMSIPEMNKWYAETQQNDPEWFNVMVGYRPELNVQRERKENSDRIRETKQNISDYARKTSFSVLGNQLRAFQAGNTKDAQGFTVAASYGDLPDFEYDTIDSNGEVIKKKYSWRKEDVNAFVDQQVQAIKSNGNLSDEERASQVLKVLQWPPSKSYADSIKLSLENALDTLTVDKLKVDGSGKAVLTPQMQDAIRMYETDPEATQQILGSKNIKDLDTLQLLMQATGNEQEGVSLFAQGKDKRNDKETVKYVTGQVQQYLSSATLSGFKDLSGDSVDVDTSLMSNYSVMRRVQSLAENLMYSGMTPEKAVEAAKAKVQSNTYVYRNTAIPRSIFNGINSEDRLKVGQQVLDYYTQDFASRTGVDPKYISTEFDIDRNVFIVSGGGAHVPYSLNDIAYSGNYILEQMAKNPQGTGRNITLPEAQNAWDENNAPQSSYWETLDQYGSPGD